MAADVQIRFRAESKQAQSEIQQLQKEIAELRQQLGQTQRSAGAAEKGVQQLGGQSRQTAGSVEVLETQMNAVRRETLEYRTAISRLNAELAENRQALLTADAAAKKTLETRNRQIRAEQGLLRARQQSSSLTLSALQQERRELGGVSGAFEKGTRSSSVFRESLASLGGTFGALGLDSLIYNVQRFTVESARASIQVDSATRALGVLVGSAAEAEAQIRAVQALADEPGLRFRQAIDGTVALRAIGVEAETTTRILKELANASAFSGGGGEFERGLLGFRQLIQRGRLSQEELNQLTENIGLASRVIREEFGTVLAEDIQEQLNETGQSIDDFVERVLTGFERLERFPLDAPSVKLKNLGNSFFEFQAAVGDLFLPTVASGAEVLTAFLDTVTRFISVSDEATESAERFHAAIADADGTVARDDAIQSRIQGLQELIKEQERAARTAGTFSHRPTLEAAAETSRTQLAELERVAAGDPAKIRELREELAELTAELERINEAQTDLNNASGVFRFFSASSAENLHTLEEADIAINEQIDSTEALLAAAEEASRGISASARRRAEAEKAAAETTAESSEQIAEAYHDAINSIDEFGGALTQIDTRFLSFHERTAAYTETIRELPPVITAVRNEFDVLAPTTARVTAIFQEYNETLGRYVAVSGIVVSSAEAEAEALDAVTQSIIQQTQDAEGLADVLSNLAQRTDAHNAVLVNPAISDAAENVRLYIREMGTLQDRFEGVDAISDRLTDSIREQTSAFDDLRRSVAGVSQARAGLQGQQLGSGVFDQFDARTPGSDFGTSFADNLRPLQAQLGQELASQAIRTAGELKRIEEDRVESLEDLERAYSEQIIAINERKRERLAEVEQEIEAERVRRLASIEAAFEDAKNAEIEARQEAADRILQIEQRAAEQRERLRERLNDRLIALEERRDDRIQDLTDGFIEREQDRQQEILQITERAAEARVEAEQTYAAEVQSINNRLVQDVLAVQRELAEEIESLESEFVQRQADRADEIVRITQEAADARAAANETFTDTMQDIYNDLVTAWDALEEGFTERQADRAEERIDIEQRAADARVDAYETYNDTIARISTNLVDEIRDIQDEITQVVADAAETRLEIEQESIESRTEANADYARRVEEIEADRDRQLEDSQRRLAEIQQEAAAARVSADEDYADRFQDIQNDLVDRVVDIQRDLNDTLNDLRDEQLDAERDRLDSLVELHEDTQQKLEDLARDRTQTLEDLRREFQRDQLDAAEQLDRDLEDAEGDPEKEAAARQKFNRRIEDLTREFNRRALDLQINQRRQQEEIARQAAARELQIAAQAQAEKERIAQEEVTARGQAQEGIASAESAAGVAFQEAQANYVPALSAHEQALLAHAQALNAINQESAAATEAVEQSISETLQTALDDTATAAQTLSETLSAVTAAEQERLAALETETSGTLSGLNQQIADAQTGTGLSFDEALANYTPAVDLNTQALQALTDALQRAESDRVSGLGAVDAAGIADRATTTEAQQALVTGAGVSIEDARANFVPALSSAAQATLTLNETMRELDTSFRAAISDIQDAGLVDRQATDTAIQEAVANAIAQQTALETQAGTTFADASLAFQPGISDIAQAGIDRDTAFGDISQTETEDIDAVNAQSIADRLETDAAITETRDAYIKASDTEIFKHNTTMLQLNTAEAADIKAVRATLSKNLESIDDKLDLELAEIRETKIVFDTRIGELIDGINAEANQDVTALKADTAAMRSSLEAIAEEARDNAWKSALLKVANVGITIAGVAAGTALGNPVAGLAVGQAVGGLVEQGGNELFHYDQTDAIARRIARQSALSRSRRTPNYLPDANQIRNARDVSREIVAGVTEGLNIGNRTDGGLGGASQQAALPNEISATIQIEFPDGSITELTDQIVRLRDQDRVNL